MQESENRTLFIRSWVVSTLMWLPFLLVVSGVESGLLENSGYLWRRSSRSFLWLWLMGIGLFWLTMNLPGKFRRTLELRADHLLSVVAVVSSGIAAFINYHVFHITAFTANWNSGLLWIILVPVLVLLFLSVAVGGAYLAARQMNDQVILRIGQFMVYGTAGGGIVSAAYVSLFFILLSPPLVDFLLWIGMFILDMTVVLVPTVVSIRVKNAHILASRLSLQAGLLALLLCANGLLAWAHLLGGWDRMLEIAYEAVQW